MAAGKHVEKDQMDAVARRDMVVAMIGELESFAKQAESEVRVRSLLQGHKRPGSFVCLATGVCVWTE